MKLIVGLGNPGRKYEFTRHNVGWWVLDHLADVWRFEPWRAEGDAVICDGVIADERVRLVKPQTYMNLSGDALRPYLRRLEWAGLHNLLVIVDDVAIPIGTWRLRAAGSAGGHNGLKSIEASLGTRNYARLRVGILPTAVDEPIDDLAEFVLQRFAVSEGETIVSLYPRLREIVEIWAREGVERAMNPRPVRAQPPPRPLRDAPDDNC